MPAQDKIEQLQAQLGYVFTDVTGLKLALTNRSAAGLHNERLEFLGDAVLELVVTHRLYHQFPGVDEGRLSRFRAQLVRKESLASKARELGVGRHLIMGPGERQSGGWERDSILADSLEAILGAIYLEAGLQTVTELITDWFEDQFNRLDARRVIKDSKTALQEFLQAEGMPLPTYALLQTTGLGHQQRFTVTCTCQLLATPAVAEGDSIKQAEQKAAETCLAQLHREKPNG